MHSIIVKSARFLFKNLFLNQKAIGFYQYLFEHSSQPLANTLIRLQTQPNFDLLWITRLLNGQKVIIPVQRDNPRSWEFAHAYHWHDVGLRNIEYVLHNYFDIDAPFYDIGANFGVRSLLPLSMRRPCVLFEPNINLRSFTNNIFALNEYKNYIIENCCLFDKNETITFYLSENTYLSSLNRSHFDEKEFSKTIMVNTICLDDWCMSHPSQYPPKVIKIDVEGAEFEVLKGASGLLGEHAPVMMVEVINDPGKREDIYHFMDMFYYRIFSILNKTKTSLRRLNKQSFINCRETNNFLFVKDQILVERLSQFVDV